MCQGAKAQLSNGKLSHSKHGYCRDGLTKGVDIFCIHCAVVSFFQLFSVCDLCVKLLEHSDEYVPLVSCTFSRTIHSNFQTGLSFTGISHRPASLSFSAPVALTICTAHFLLQYHQQEETQTLICLSIPRLGSGDLRISAQFPEPSVNSVCWCQALHQLLWGKIYKKKKKYFCLQELA